MIDVTTGAEQNASRRASSAAGIRAPAGRSQQVSTFLVFLIAGLAVSAWAPLVPFAKQRLGNIDEGTLGLLLLCFGIGSIVAMPLTGGLSAQIGCRRVILGACALMALALPCLAIMNTPVSMGLALGCFGAGMGTLDVAMNLQAVMVERHSGRPMMSGFHGFYSVGGIAGAATVSGLLATGWFSPFGAVCVIVAMVLAALAFATPGLLRHGHDSEEKPPLFVVPKGLVLLIGVLCFICFLAEGAVRDWSAVFLSSTRGAEPALAGMGYAMFSAAMAGGRLAGNRIRAVVSEQWILLLGGCVAAAGYFVVVLFPSPGVDLAGFTLVGLGASNLVPVLFSITGRSRIMPSSLAIAAITTIGYAGVLAGPAAIGAVAHVAGLRIAFVLLALALVAVAANFRIAKL